MKPVIGILIIDDHAVVREGLRVFLETEPDLRVLGAAATGAEGVALCASKRPDVVLLDLKLPDLDGLEVARRIRADDPATKVLVLTSHEGEAALLEALEIGVAGYLLKDAPGGELAAAVRRAASGGTVIAPRLMPFLVQAARVRNALPEDPLTRLSQREREVLELIGEGLSNAQIAERLAIGDKTVKTHVSNVLAKLSLTDRTQAAVYAWRRGVLRAQN